MSHDSTYSPLDLFLSLLPGESTQLSENEAWERSYLVIDVANATLPTSFLFNGKGGFDSISGSSLRDYIWVEGYLSEPSEVWGSHNLDNVNAYANEGDDVFRIYANSTGTNTAWVSRSSYLSGGEGTDTLFVNGEWDSSWDLTSLSLSSVETLALSWWPQADAPLEVRLTGGQWSQLQTIHVDEANSPDALRIVVDGVEKIDWQGEKVVVNTSTLGFDYAGDSTGHVLGTAGTDNLYAPSTEFPFYIRVSGDAEAGQWGATTQITRLGGDTSDLALPTNMSSMNSRIFHVKSDTGTPEGSYILVSREYSPSGGTDYTLVFSKFDSTGSPSLNFGVAGKVSVTLDGGTNISVQTLVQDADGNLLFLDASDPAQTVLRKVSAADGDNQVVSLSGTTLDPSIRLLGAGSDDLGVDVLYLTRSPSEVLIAQEGAGGVFTVGQPVMVNSSLPSNTSNYLVDSSGALKWRSDASTNPELYGLSPDGALVKLVFVTGGQGGPNTLTWDEATRTLSVNNPAGAYQDAVPSSDGGLYWIDGFNLVSLTATPGQEPSISSVFISTEPPPLATGDGFSSDPQALWVKVLGVGADGTILLQHEINVPSSASGLTEERIYALSKFDLVDGSYVLDPSVGINGYVYRSGSVNKTDVSYQDGEFVIISPSSSWGSSGDFVLSQKVVGEGYEWWWDLSPDSSGLYTLVGSGYDQQIELAVQALQDYSTEENESFTLTLENANGTTYPITPSSVAFTIADNDIRLPGLDLNGADKGGSETYSDRGAFSYGNYDFIPTVDNHIRFWDAEIGVSAGVSAFRLSVDTTQFVTNTNDYDWVFGWEGRITDQDLSGIEYPQEWTSLDTFIPDYAAGVHSFHGGFRIPLTDQPDSPDEAFRFADWNGKLLIIQQSLEADSLVLTIQTGDGKPLSSAEAEDFFRSNVGIAYKDLESARATEFRDRIEVSVEVSSDGSNWISADPYQAGTTVFEFHNESAHAVAATFDKNFVEIIFQAGDVENLNYEVADISFDDWNSWLGEPLPSHFTVMVDGSQVNVLQTYQAQSLVLVLSEDISDASSVQVTYTDPNSGVDDIYNVIQTWGGADTPSFTLTATQAPQISVTLNVGSGAQLGWDENEAEDRYFNGDWGDFHTSQLNVVSVSAGVATVQFEPLGWQNNPNYDPFITDSGLLVSYPYVKGVMEIKIDASFSVDGSPVTLSPGGTVAASDVFGYNSSANLFSFGSAVLVSQDGSSEARAFDLATYTVRDGVDASRIVASEFMPGLSMEMFGGAYDDTLGLPLNFNYFSASAGGGNDLIYAGTAGARIDGGAGIDKVVFDGARSDYSFNPDDALGGTLTVTGPGSIDGTFVTYTLRGVEKMAFSDETVVLPNPVVLPFNYTPEFSAFVENIVWDLDGLGSMIATGQDLNILDLTVLQEVMLSADLGLVLGEDALGSVYVEVSGYTGFIVSGDNATYDSNPSGYVYVDPYADEADVVGLRGLISTNRDADDIVIVRGSLLNTDIALKGDNSLAGTFDVLAFVDGSDGVPSGVTIDLGDSYNGYTDFIGGGIEGRVSGADGLIGASGDDHFTGYEDRANALFGGAGEDVLIGGDLGDLLVGGLGYDRLEGGLGDDILVDFDSASLIGGEGKDLYVVSDASVIEDFDYAADGASRPGRNSWDDRVAFAISLSTLQTLGMLQGAQAGQELSAADYAQLRQSVEFEVVEDGVDLFTINAFVLQPSIEPGGSPTRIDLGSFQTRFQGSVDNPNEAIKVSAISQDFDVARVWENVLPDVMLSDGVPTATDSPVATIFDDKILLFAGLEISDSSIVRIPIPPGDVPVVLFARANGLSTIFELEPLNTDTVVIGGSRGDEYRFAAATAPVNPDAPEAPDADDLFQTSLIIDRGGIQSRDLINLGNLTVDDVSFSRIEIGKEGEVSLGVSWQDVADFNDGNIEVAYQYSSLTSRFRIEDVELSGQLYDLGSTKAMGTELHTSGNRDAILVGREGEADTFVINKGEKSNGNQALDIYLWGFGEEDVISLDGFGQITPSVVDGTGDPTMRTITFNDGANEWTVNLHARGATNGFDDDFLLLDRSALGA